MTLFNWAKEKIKKMTMWDMGAVKVICIIIGMVLGARFSLWVITNWVPLVFVALVLWIWLIYKIYFKK